MDLIDCEIEDGGEGREDVQKETYIESEDFHGKSQRLQSITHNRRHDKRILQKPKSKVHRLRINHRI
jgi:hypothetical protein